MSKEDETGRIRVSRELEWVANKPKPMAFVSVTAKKDAGFAVTPRRSALGYDCIGIMFSEEEQVRQILPMLNGRIPTILVDVEAKKPIDLMALARELMPQARLIPCKPNDAAVESLDLLLQNRIGPDLSGKKILLYAMGNIGTKTALRLAERGAEVLTVSRDTKKGTQICDALNLILPRHSPYPIRPLSDMGEIADSSLDAFISCNSSRGKLGAEIAPLIKDNAVVVDVGIDNFTQDFYTAAKHRSFHCYRLDIRIGFPYLLMPLFDNIERFLTHVCGSSMLKENVCIVSGGFVGQRGSVIVDNIHAPTQAVGVANGIGGVIPEAELEREHRKNISIVRAHVESNT